MVWVKVVGTGVARIGRNPFLLLRGPGTLHAGKRGGKPFHKETGSYDWSTGPNRCPPDAGRDVVGCVPSPGGDNEPQVNMIDPVICLVKLY